MKECAQWERAFNHLFTFPYFVNDISFELDPASTNYYIYIRFIVEGRLYTFRHIHVPDNEQSTLQVLNAFREHVEYIKEHGRVPIRVDD